MATYLCEYSAFCSSQLLNLFVLYCSKDALKALLEIQISCSYHWMHL